MNNNAVIESIISRRSIRKFTDTEISIEDLSAILECGRWAPSGMNNQPWRFVIISSDEMKESLAALTKYGRIIKSSSACIAVFYSIESGYNRDKDILGIGACVQNMLLAAHSLGIGAAWLGEILNRKAEVNEAIQISEGNELLAVIALGRPAETPKIGRESLDSLIIKRL